MTKFNSTSNIIINGTNKADFIYNDNADNVTIYAGEGNDQITNDVGSYVYLDGENNPSRAFASVLSDSRKLSE